MSLYRHLEAVSEAAIASTNDKLHQFLAHAKTEPASLKEKVSIQYLAQEIGMRLFRFLM